MPPTLPAALIPANYADLRALAAAMLSESQPSLAATGIVHEAFLRMAGAAGVGGRDAPVGGGASFDSRAEFMAYAARTIRSILVDHARRRCAAKRGGGGRPRPLDEQDERSIPRELTAAGLIDLDEALERLGALCERQRRVVELRFFCQLSVEQTATALGVSPRTVKSDWRCARAWLRQELAR